MPFQSVPDTAEFVVRCERSTDYPVVNVFHFRDTIDAWDVPHLTDIANGIVTWWTNRVRALQNTGIVLTSVKGRNLEVENGAQVEVNPNLAGTSTDPIGGSICAAVLAWKCDPGAPPARGRTYHGPLTEGMFTGDALDESDRVAVEDAYDALRTDIGGLFESAAQVIVSRFSGTSLVEHPDGTITREPTLRATGLTNTIESVTCRAVIGSQERRRR